MLTELGFRGIIAINPPIVLTMLFLSILLVTVLLERIWTFLSSARWKESLWKQITDDIRSGRLHDARTLCVNKSNVYARVFYSIINSTNLSRADNEDLAQIEKENQQERLRKRLGLFATLAFVSPLIGLLGTVLGIMHAFHDLGRSGSGGANIVASGISEALITTAAGIIVAVPAAMLYNYFTYRLRGIVVRMNNYAQELVILLYGGEETGYTKASLVQPKPGDPHAKTNR